MFCTLVENKLKLMLTYHSSSIFLLPIILLSCSPNGLVEKSGQWDRIQHGQYLVENNTWNVQTVKSTWSETIFYDTIKGSLGWKWDFSDEKDMPDTYNVKSFPEVIFGQKPYSGYQSTTLKLPVKLSSARLKLEYEYSANATGAYNTSTDISFTDSNNPAEKNIRAKMMIWFDHQNFHFFESEKLTDAVIERIKYKIYVDTSHVGPEGKWVFIALLPERFPASGDLNLNEYFDYFLSTGALKKDWYLSSIEVGSEISSGKGVVTFSKFIIH
jgi:hypothetical protein